MIKCDIVKEAWKLRNAVTEGEVDKLIAYMAAFREDFQAKA